MVIRSRYANANTMTMQPPIHAIHAQNDVAHAEKSPNNTNEFYFNPEKHSTVTNIMVAVFFASGSFLTS